MKKLNTYNVEDRPHVVDLDINFAGNFNQDQGTAPTNH